MARRYSSNLLINSFIWNSSSNNCYNTIRDSGVLSLPCVKTFNNLSKLVPVKSGLSDCNYLKLRVSQLSNLQRYVLLMIDEIYINGRVEYVHGQVYGKEEDGSKAKTILAFMIKSLMGKYKDVV